MAASSACAVAGLVGKLLAIVVAERDDPCDRSHPAEAHSRRFSVQFVRLVEDSIELSSTVRADAWSGYLPQKANSYLYRISNQKAHPELASELLPRLYRSFRS